MLYSAWQIAAWPDVRIPTEQFEIVSQDFRELGSTTSDRAGLRCGQVVWGGEWRGELVAIAWDWEEERSHVVAMCDPMTILSNARLIGPDGFAIPNCLRALHLHSAIYDFCWQAQLCAAGSRQRAHAIR